jgi:GxxExxY protein
MLKRTLTAADFESDRTPVENAVFFPPLADQLAHAANLVWTELGCGHEESIYRTALALALASCGLHSRQEVCVPVMFLGKCVGTGRADIIVTGDIILELKTISKLNNQARAQLKAYMCSLEINRGLLINFPSTGGNLEFVWCELDAGKKHVYWTKPHFLAAK